MKAFALFFLLLIQTQISAAQRLPTFIDFRLHDFSKLSGYESFNETDMNRFQSFNGAIELCPFFAYLKNTYAIDAAFETGTWTGNTTEFFGFLFDKAYTVELAHNLYQMAVSKFQENPNIVAFYGNSPDVLRSQLPKLKNKRILFYLDAHWYADWPLLNELEEISKTHKNNCIIVIDDFKVPGRRDIPYDSYGRNECSYEYVREKLAKIFTTYDYYYLIPKTVAQRAKFVAIPRQWN